MARVITAAIRRNARAFIIWRHCNARDWDCSVPEVAEALGLSVDTVRGYCVKRGWIGRMRSAQTDRQIAGQYTSTDDEPAADVMSLLNAAA